MQWRLTRYILSETLPGLFLGIFAFIFVLLMFQILRLMEFFLIHGVDFTKILEILWSMSISFVPTLLPMATLFAVVLAFSRFSNDSETVGFISLGVSPSQTLKPLLALGLALSLVSCYASFYLAPEGNRRFELIMHDLSQSKVTSVIKENTFTESFYNLVIFALGSDTKTGQLDKVFIFDEQNTATPLSIIAQGGIVFTKNTANKNSLWIKLFEGDIHRQETNHTKINFGEFEVKLIDSKQIQAEIHKSPNSWTPTDIRAYLNPTTLTPAALENLLLAKVELHKRWAVGATCLILCLLGFTLGFNPNRRVKGNGFVLSLFIILGYWILLVAFENLARSSLLPAFFAMWAPNILFLSWGLWRFKKILG